MRTVIISGGNIEEEFAVKFLKSMVFSAIIGVDSGLEFLKKQNIYPTHVIGDFDSLSQETYRYYKENANCIWKELVPEKDETDTQAAITWALELHSTEIWILGGIGSRIDHLLGNIQILQIPLKRKVPCFLVDSHNKICLLDKGISIKKMEQYGKFVSLLPLTTQVEGLTLDGFKYPLYKHTLTSDNALGVSNEILENVAEITFEKGILIVIQSKD
ncbi:thiamine diphosphokinase [Anaerosacchariphilus polymeriproducens]|uniref:Thiamine diphosphokinase n=1 Tax=Anaerosacchariphilus polymeriproducens TaxID=1812858 RepID=A0A371AXK7_9FIRM|nr:thiamine diphosphokinase [Anaerosacchariphilus polymeriproducens]RDU24316.1 thiamine diphosphokinase [Anaerosacchariphilus polymeriproducens]